MIDSVTRAYTVKPLRPFFLIFGISALLMGLVAVVLLGSQAHFAWFLVAGGVVLLVLTPFLDRIIAWLGGPVPYTSGDPLISRTETRQEEAARRAS